MLVNDVALMADAVYNLNAVPDGLTRIDLQTASGSYDGFQAAAYQCGNGIGITFRGTAVKGDVLTDAALGIGIQQRLLSAGRGVHPASPQQNCRYH